MSSSFSSDPSRSTSPGDIVRDEKRLQALRRYDVLDTAPEPAFDRITRLAAHLLDAPAALVNLIDRDRQWFKSAVGLSDAQTGLDVSFCVHTLEQGDVVAVEDLSEDERFADTPYVTDHGFRFYAGAPLVTPDDHQLGTLCVLDTEPRSPTEAALDRLGDLAAMVVDELELRRERAEHKQARADLEEHREWLRHVQELADVGGSAYDPQTESVSWTDQTYRIFGLSPGADLDLETTVDFYTPESRSVIEPEVERLLDEGGRYDLELDVVRADGERRRVRTIAEARRDDDEPSRIVGAIQDVTEQHRDRRRKEFQSRVFEWIATGTPIGDVLDEIAQFVEEELPGTTVSILALDDDRLYHAGGPSLPEDYVAALDGVEIGPDVGTCGAAASRDQEVITEDIREDDRWDDFRPAADRAGFRSCASQTIQGSDGTVLGTFAVYRDEPGPPIPADRDLVERMSHVASVALERDRRERALRASEERWRTLVEEHPGPIHVTVDGTFAYANEALAELFGVETAAALVGKDVLSFAHPDERARIRERVQRLTDTREATPLIEHKIVRADGDERTVLVQSVPITYQGQEAAQTMMWDVTERRTAERELRESYERLRLALRAADAGTFEYDIATNRVRWDDRTRDLFGLDPESRVHEGGLLEEIVLEADRARLNEAFEQAAEETERVDVSFRVRRADDGEVRHIRSHGIVLPAGADAPGRVIGINQDVTERRRRKRALERQNDLFAKAQDIASVGAWEYDLRAGEATLSDEAYRIHGLAPDAEMTPDRGIEFFHPDDRPVIREAFTRAVEEGEPYDLELRLITDDGTQRWVRTRGEPQRDDGEIVRLRGTIQDITDQKETEQELRRSREQLSMAVEGGNIGTWNWDLTTDAVRFNDRWAEMLGYAREELDFHFSTWEELVHPEDLPRALDDLRAYLEGEADTYDPEIRMRTKSGDWRWIQTIGRVVERDEEGTVARLAGIHLDIDERKRAEQALREAKARYQTLIEHFPDGGVFLFDENLEYTIAGGKGLAAAGFSPSDFAGKTPRDLFPTEIAEEQMRCYRHALEGQKKGFEQTFDGRHYRVQTLPIREGNGEVVAGMAVSQDITERKETRQRLERYRAYTDRLLDAVDDLFFVLGEEAQFRRWNERLPEVTGYSDDELAEMTAFDLVPESEHERVAATVGNAFVSGSVQAELPLLRKDGTTFPYEFVGSLVRSPEGELQIVGVGRDITERKRRKEALERKNDLFTRAQDIASVGAWEYDVRAGELTTTDEMSRIFGHSPGTDMTVEQRILSHHPDDQPTIRAALRRAIEEGEPYDLELRLVRDDGTQRWIHSRGEPQLEDGEIVRVRGTIQDITERRRQREALKEAKDAAEEADRIKSALLSNMNHEFRTPLTSIISFSELLSREPDLAETFADRILGGGRRLLHTLNTVMDFAELEAGSVSVTPMRVDVNSLVRSTVDTFSHLVGQDLSVQIHVPTEGLTVSQDEHHLERVLTHLVHNALKFTEEGTIEITARRASDGVAVSVSDPGIGIPPEALPHVFDEFAQASSGSDRTHEGNGIGLTVVKRLVAHMDGTVALDSTPGAGTEVTVRLPNLE